MRRLLIIGCGDVVRRALPQLTQHWRVYALVRRRDPALAALGITQLIGDLDRADSLRRLRGIAEAVIHSAPPPDSGTADPRTRHLLACLANRPAAPRRAGRSLLQRLVYISTTGVYGDCHGDVIDESRATAAHSARAKRRVDAECELRRFGRNAACRVCILRAPGIYASDRLPLERLHKQMPLFAAGDDAFTNHIHAEDLAQACVAALRRGRPNRVYNICDDSVLRMGEWYDKLADSFNLPRAPRLPRAEAERQLSPMQLSFMGESRRIGNARMKRELSLQLRYRTVDDGIRAARNSCQEIVHAVA